MGDMAEHDATRADDFDDPDDFDTISTASAPPVAKADPKRPEASRGRYYLPDPETGKRTGLQRVTNFTKLSDDTYHLELWKQRNVLKGAALLVQSGRLTVEQLAASDVKQDRKRMDNMVTAAQDAAEAYKMADAGTALHKSAELADYAGGDLNRVPVEHRRKIRLYLDALAANGLTVVDDMIERVIVCAVYEVAGKFDRIFRLPDGSLVIGDLKTGDSLDLSMPGIAAQLEAYQRGINTHGIWDGTRYDTSLKVREDFGIVVHLPSTRDEVSVEMVDLAEGRRINECNLLVKRTRRIKAKHVARPFDPAVYGASRDAAHWHWCEQLNAAHDRRQMIDVATRARSLGQWTERLAQVARELEAEMKQAAGAMGS